MGSGDLHALVAGFEGGAASYDRGRPAYDPAVIDAIVEALDVDAGARVLDLAAGTGLLSRPLLARGLDVVAVEPLGAMREVLARAIGAERARDGRAEAIPLPDGHIDAVVCGDAFHWFDGDRAAAELHRVLRPGAGLCVAFIAPGWREDARRGSARPVRCSSRCGARRVIPTWPRSSAAPHWNATAASRPSTAARCDSRTRPTATACWPTSRRSASSVRSPTASGRRSSAA